MMDERDGSDAAMEEAARLQIELDALHAKAHRVQLRAEAAEAKLAKVREWAIEDISHDDREGFEAAQEEVCDILGVRWTGDDWSDILDAEPPTATVQPTEEGEQGETKWK